MTYSDNTANNKIIKEIGGIKKVKQRLKTRILCPTYFFYFHSNICLHDESKMVIIHSNKYLNEDGMII
ncbi:beta-lactamase [Staphylococcus aureus]|nr:beta-lactamase [Staphylococcus aureus]